MPAGAFPFVLVMVLALVILALFPSLSTWLARM
jgi:TRAP-type C4-dicarboxylate transport system permease large subunit